MASKPPDRIDAQALKARHDLARVIMAELGRPPDRGDVNHGRCSWRCPFHDDHDPSLVVFNDRQAWQCYPCGKGGDVFTFIEMFRGCSFPQAVKHLAGDSMPATMVPMAPRPKPKAQPRVTGRITEAQAWSAVEVAEQRLWSPAGADHLHYLTIVRMLSPATIKAGRLGSTPHAAGVSWKRQSPPAITIPWIDAGRLVKLQVRPDEAWRNRFPHDARPGKYLEAFNDHGRRVCYPSPATIRLRKPLIVVEGELDALLLGQALEDMAGVITLGSTGEKVDPSKLFVATSSGLWFIATDRDEAGDKAATKWPPKARRVKPPGNLKDWSDTAAFGVDLARFWRDVFNGNLTPPAFTWDELSRMRSGPALNDATPGIIVDNLPLRRTLAYADGAR